MPHIALVTAFAAAHLDEDLAPLVDAVSSTGAEVTVASWDDRSVDWSGFDAAVVRSAWDYPPRLAEFLGWVDATAGVTRLFNTATTIRWNVDKRYLEDLRDAGVPTVPTTFHPPGSTVEWPDSPEFVVKPSISAGSRDTARFGRNDTGAATALIDGIWASGRTAMLQPYLARVDSAGEHALVLFDGTLSHAFRKGPLLRPSATPTEDLFAAEQIDPAVPSPEQIEVARAALEVASDRTTTMPLYARVDLAPGADGSPVILELELIEPSVYHRTAPASATAFADAILGRLEAE